MKDQIKSKQDAFNRVWTHYILHHHSFSYDPEKEIPVMQDAELNKDPFRVLIPDEKFKRDFQVNSPTAIMRLHGLRRYFKNINREVEFIFSLMGAHDAAIYKAVKYNLGNIRVRRIYRIFRNSLRKNLESVAKAYKLEIPSSRPYPVPKMAKKRVKKHV